MRDIKVGDKVSINDPKDFTTLMTVCECLQESYEVLGIGTPPDGWPSNDGCPEDAVYFLDDANRYTQLENDDVTLIK